MTINLDTLNNYIHTDLHSKETSTPETNFRAILKKMVSIISVTMGPRGRTVDLHSTQSGVVEKQVTKDGVSVANAILPRNECEKSVYQQLAASCRNTEKLADDGTTSTAVMSLAFYEKILELKEYGSTDDFKFNGIHDLVDKLEAYNNEVIEAIKESAKQVTIESNELKQALLTTSNRDEEMVNKVLDFAKEYPEDIDRLDLSKGLVNDKEDKLEIKKGGARWKIDVASTATVLRDSTEYLTNKPLFINCINTDLNSSTLLPDMVNIATFFGNQRELTVVFLNRSWSEELRDEMFNNAPNAILMKLPGTGTNQLGYMDDITFLCEPFPTREVVGRLSEGKPKEGLIKYLDLADKAQMKVIGYQPGLVTIKRDELIVEMADELRNSERYRDYIKVLKLKLEDLNPKIHVLEIQAYRRRLKALEGFQAKLVVNGTTRNILNEKYDRYQDTIGAMRSIPKTGIVAGGGATYIRAAEKCGGSDLIKSVYSEVFKALIANSDIDLGITMNEVITRLSSEDGITVDVFNAEFVNAFDNGIVDPVTNLTATLKNAFDCAKVLVKVEWVVEPRSY